MTSELIPFIENAIEQQGWPYKVTASDENIILELATNDAAYIRTNKVSEAFKITVKLETKKGKLLAYVHDEVFKLISEPAGAITLGEALELSDAAGAEESETVTPEDGWKLFVARRWLLSIIRFKGYTVKDTKKTGSRGAVIITSVIALFVILALAFGGVANSMANGAIQGNETVKVTNSHGTKDTVLNDFFK